MGRFAMFTPRKKDQEDFLKISSVERVLLEVPKMQPQSLRLSKTLSRCDGCKYFVYSAGRAWSNEGDCTQFRTPVRGDFVCDSYEGIDESGL